jgi:hypothetical protein
LEDEGDEGNREHVVGIVAGEVMRVDDRDDNEVDGADICALGHMLKMRRYHAPPKLT